MGDRLLKKSLVEGVASSLEPERWGVGNACKPRHSAKPG
jgi:hypothetical protein